MLREMHAPEGGFYSALDADSEGHEGKFYVWTPDEVRARLSAEEYAVAAPVYGFDLPPNFENAHWNPILARPLEAVAAELGLAESEAAARLKNARQRLFAARETRVRPGRDDKQLTSWNALMIAGLAHAGRVMARPDWIAEALEHRDDAARLADIKGRVHELMAQRPIPGCGVYRDVDDDDSNCNAHGEGAGGSSWRTVDYDPDEDMA